MGYLIEIGVQVSLNRNSGIIELQGEEIDGVLITPWIKGVVRRDDSLAHVVLFFVSRDGAKVVAGKKFAFEIPVPFSVSIEKQRSFPVLGAVTSLRFSSKGGHLADLRSYLEQDWELNQFLLERARMWNSILIAPIIAHDTDSIDALGILGSPQIAPSRELFDCYNIIGNRLRQALRH